MNSFYKTVCVLSLFLIIILSTGISYPYEKAWGTEYKKFIASIEKGTEYTEFDPAEKPDYKNRIASFIYPLNSAAKKEIKIVRLKIKPETDYLFYGGKLCGITENRGLINSKDGEKILKDLTRKFGEPETDRKSSLYVYTFKKNRTRIILYQQLTDNDIMRCRVYIYTNDIFNTLFSD